MERTKWTDDRLDDAFEQLRIEMRAGFDDVRAEMRAGFADVRAEMNGRFAEINGRFADTDGRFAELNGRFAEINGRFAEQGTELRGIRRELAQMKIFMLTGLVTILAAFIALHG